MLHEFDFIRTLLAPLTDAAPGADHLTNDGAALACPAGETLVVTSDTLVAGVHFFGWETPDLLARKALRVNLSDLAAMAARPVAYTLNLALPRELADNEGWLRGLCDGLKSDQEAYGWSLIGGDTVGTPGPLTLTVTAFGAVNGRGPLRRAGAQPGDGIYVTGTLGDARAGLEQLRKTPSSNGELVARYLLPNPRVDLALQLAPYMTAGLDISDGLSGDLGHICAASGVGAKVNLEALPRSAAFREGGLPLAWAVGGGDDYELLFTARPGDEAEVFATAARLHTPLTRIGDIEEASGIRWLTASGADADIETTSFQHF